MFTAQPSAFSLLLEMGTLGWHPPKKYEMPFGITTRRFDYPDIYQGNLIAKTLHLFYLFDSMKMATRFPKWPSHELRNPPVRVAIRWQAEQQ